MCSFAMAFLLLHATWSRCTFQATFVTRARPPARHDECQCERSMTAIVPRINSNLWLQAPLGTRASSLLRVSRMHSSQTRVGLLKNDFNRMHMFVMLTHVGHGTADDFVAGALVDHGRCDRRSRRVARRQQGERVTRLSHDQPGTFKAPGLHCWTHAKSGSADRAPPIQRARLRIFEDGRHTVTR